MLSHAAPLRGHLGTRRPASASLTRLALRRCLQRPHTAAARDAQLPKLRGHFGTRYLPTPRTMPRCDTTLIALRTTQAGNANSAGESSYRKPLR